MNVISLPQSVYAVSGGGKDYATKDLRSFDFTGQNLAGKDFTQCGNLYSNNSLIFP
jgi:hypothetical protein